MVHIESVGGRRFTVLEPKMVQEYDGFLSEGKSFMKAYL